MAVNRLYPYEPIQDARLAPHNPDYRPNYAGPPASYSQQIPRSGEHGAQFEGPSMYHYSASHGTAGSIFWVRISDMLQYPINTLCLRLRFGKVPLPTAYEHSHQSVSVTVPYWTDTAWHSKSVPVSLLVLDGQSGHIIDEKHVCEYVYVDSPGTATQKRKRGAPLMEQNRQGSPSGRHLGLSPRSDLAAAPQFYRQSSASPGYHSNVHRPSPYHPYGSPQPQRPYHAASPSESFQNRIHGSAQEPSRYTTSTPLYSSPQYPPRPASVMYGSPQSLPATLPRPDVPLDSISPVETYDSSRAPVLQRTSTLSSGPGSTSSDAKVVTPAVPAPWMPPARVRLEIKGELSSHTRYDWSQQELIQNRRLVQFNRILKGNTLTINSYPYDPPEKRLYRDTVVISCIYWPEKNGCYFTSVDIIMLLEFLIGNTFAVDEKHRIRRNLEGFKPKTVCKSKSNDQANKSFQELIMSFPDPKPRRIDKDIKVFHWKNLGDALEKIVGKYSATYDGLRERAASHEGSEERMPPPTSLRRHDTNDSAGSDYQQRSLSQPSPNELSYMSISSSDLALPSLRNDHNDTILAKLRHNPSPRPPNAGLSINVPRLASNLPSLDSALPFDAERRSSGLNLTASGGGGAPTLRSASIEFNDLFQSPSTYPGASASWPNSSSNSAYFPPPTAGFGPGPGHDPVKRLYE